MTKYARIDGDTVVELFETSADIKELFHPAIVWVEFTTEDFEVGDSYKEGQLVKFTQDQIQPERAWRDSQLLYADTELSKVQDGDSGAIGTVSQWREYRKALRGWPTSPYFPNKNHRPSAPI